MKLNYTIKHTILAAILIFITAGCSENQNILWDNSNAFIFIDQGYYEINEDANTTTTVRIPIASAPLQNDVIITFETDTLGHGTDGAVEGEDYTIIFPSIKQVKISAGNAYAFITIAPINNDEMELDNRYFNIRLTSNDSNFPMGVDGTDTTVIAIFDDEHPLNFMFGDYWLNYYSYVDESVKEVTNAIKIVKGSKTAVDVRLGFYFDGSTYARGEVDTLMNTVSIPYGQTTFNEDETILRVYGTDSVLGEIIEEGALIGDLDRNTMKITFRNPFVLGEITDGELSYDDVYIHPTFTKIEN